MLDQVWNVMGIDTTTGLNATILDTLAYLHCEG